MEIDFYFDPSCPWCWVTSRWLVEVSESRALKINWLPFSLAIKNNELDGQDVTGHLDTHTIAHQVLRMIESIHENEKIDRGTLYTEFGKSYFIDKKLDDDIFMGEVLKRLDLDEKYLLDATSTKFDEMLKSHIDNAITVVGDDIGVPLIIFKNENSEKQGFFGPVLQGLPEKEQGLILWDALSKLGSNSSFYELKRTRKGRSKVKTTKRVFPEFIQS
ncbi:MAG TPA: DsbA family protein [Acidimicrobiia bacterium]|nr:DsbA family protein [Acidimicrobiia bacterium]